MIWWILSALATLAGAVITAVGAHRWWRARGAAIEKELASVLAAKEQRDAYDSALRKWNERNKEINNDLSHHLDNGDLNDAIDRLRKDP